VSTSSSSRFTIIIHASIVITDGINMIAIGLVVVLSLLILLLLCLSFYIVG